jgi:hypothetical protein
MNRAEIRDGLLEASADLEDLAATLDRLASRIGVAASSIDPLDALVEWAEKNEPAIQDQIARFDLRKILDDIRSSRDV